MTTLRAAVLTPLSPTTYQWVEDAYIAIDETGCFSSVTPYAGQPVEEDLRPAVVVPGFVDAHIHFPQTRIIGSASGPLLQWLDETTFPEEARFEDPAYAAIIAEEFCQHLLAAGTTLSLIYGSVHSSAAHILFETLNRHGLRAMAGPVLMDTNCPQALQVPPEIAMESLRELAELWHNRNGRLQIAVIPRFALSCSPEMMRQAGALSRELGLWVSTHLSETPFECAEATRLFGTEDYLTIYEEAGLVHNRSVFAHCIHLSDSEVERMAQAQAVVAHCPDSNDFLGSGGMPIGRLVDAGLTVAMGTDVAGGRSFRVPHALSRAYDNALRTGSEMGLARLLWLGTRGGALALGHDQVGAISVGLAADFVCINRPEWVTSPEQVLARLLFFAEAPAVQSTWIDGRRVWTR